MTPSFDPTSAITPPVRRKGRQRLAAAAMAGSLAVLGTAGVVGGTASADGGAAGLRTATVAEREVTQTLDLTGTVVPVAQAAVAFPTAGSVASVDVAVGDTVTIGQQLATLDTTSSTTPWSPRRRRWPWPSSRSSRRSTARS